MREEDIGDGQCSQAFSGPRSEAKDNPSSEFGGERLGECDPNETEEVNGEGQDWEMKTRISNGWSYDLNIETYCTLVDDQVW